MKATSISFKISSAELGFAVFSRQKLMFWEAHHYVCESREVEAKLIAEAVRAVEKFSVAAVVLEPLSAMEVKAAGFGTTLRTRLRDVNAIPIFEITEQQVFESFAFPAVGSRDELRQILATVFPQLQSNCLARHCLDAAALGLYFETDRLLSIQKE